LIEPAREFHNFHYILKVKKLLVLELLSLVPFDLLDCFGPSPVG